MKNKKTGLEIYSSTFGDILIESNGKAITKVKLISKNGERPETRPDRQTTPDALTEKATRQLEEYFSGKRKKFDLPLDPHGTKFQSSVWKALLEIPYGETRSYKQIAQMIDNPKACRAVGLANNKNPIWIIIPCHRVIGSDGSLTGYGGGLEMKQKLLEIER